MEYLWVSSNWTEIYSDYGHIASSIAFAYEDLKLKYPDKRISVIFQPHQIARIIMNRDLFPMAFEWYNQIFIYDIYAAREKINDYKRQIKSITNSSNEILLDLVSLWNAFAKHCGGVYLVTFEEIKWVLDLMWYDEILIFFSAGELDYDFRKYLWTIT